MYRFSTEIDIAAAPERTWAVLCDIERWPEWNTSIESVRRLEPSPFAIGTRAEIAQPKLPAAVWQVIAIDPGRSFTWDTHNMGVTTIGVHQVQPSTEGCRVLLSVELTGPLAAIVWPLSHKLTEEYVLAEAAGLKRASENSS